MFSDQVKYVIPFQQLPSDQFKYDAKQLRPDQTGHLYLDPCGSSSSSRDQSEQFLFDQPHPVCQPQAAKKTKVEISNPKFWHLPMMALIGIHAEDLRHNIDNLVTLPPAAEPFIIPQDVLSSALASCLSQRHRFATTVLRHICTIGDVYIGNVSGKFFRSPGHMVNRKICPIKMDALEKICFEFFPSSDKDREKDWKIVVTALHKAVWYARKYIRNLLDISAIEKDLMASKTACRCDI